MADLHQESADYHKDLAEHYKRRKEADSKANKVDTSLTDDEDYGTKSTDGKVPNLQNRPNGMGRIGRGTPGITLDLTNHTEELDPIELLNASNALAGTPSHEQYDDLHNGNQNTHDDDDLKFYNSRGDKDNDEHEVEMRHKKDRKTLTQLLESLRMRGVGVTKSLEVKADDENPSEKANRLSRVAHEATNNTDHSQVERHGDFTKLNSDTSKYTSSAKTMNDHDNSKWAHGTLHIAHLDTAQRLFKEGKEEDSAKHFDAAIAHNDAALAHRKGYEHVRDSGVARDKKEIKSLKNNLLIKADDDDDDSSELSESAHQASEKAHAASMNTSGEEQSSLIAKSKSAYDASNDARHSLTDSSGVGSSGTHRQEAIQHHEEAAQRHRARGGPGDIDAAMAHEEAAQKHSIALQNINKSLDCDEDSSYDFTNGHSKGHNKSLVNKNNSKIIKSKNFNQPSDEAVGHTVDAVYASKLAGLNTHERLVPLINKLSEQADIGDPRKMQKAHVNLGLAHMELEKDHSNRYAKVIREGPSEDIPKEADAAQAHRLAARSHFKASDVIGGKGKDKESKAIGDTLEDDFDDNVIIKAEEYKERRNSSPPEVIAEYIVNHLTQRGGPVQHTHLSQSLHMTGEALSRGIEHALDNNLIQRYKIPSEGRGKPSTYYRLPSDEHLPEYTPSIKRRTLYDPEKEKQIKQRWIDKLNNLSHPEMADKIVSILQKKGPLGHSELTQSIGNSMVDIKGGVEHAVNNGLVIRHNKVAPISNRGQKASKVSTLYSLPEHNLTSEEIETKAIGDNRYASAMNPDDVANDEEDVLAVDDTAGRNEPSPAIRAFLNLSQMLMDACDYLTLDIQASDDIQARKIARQLCEQMRTMAGQTMEIAQQMKVRLDAASGFTGEYDSPNDNLEQDDGSDSESSAMNAEQQLNNVTNLQGGQGNIDRSNSDAPSKTGNTKPSKKKMMKKSLDLYIPDEAEIPNRDDRGFIICKGMYWKPRRFTRAHLKDLDSLEQQKAIAADYEETMRELEYLAQEAQAYNIAAEYHKNR